MITIDFIIFHLKRLPLCLVYGDREYKKGSMLFYKYQYYITIIVGTSMQCWGESPDLCSFKFRLKCFALCLVDGDREYKNGSVLLYKCYYCIAIILGISIQCWGNHLMYVALIYIT